MAIPTPSAKIVMSGHLLHSTEIWATSLSLHRYSGSSSLVKPEVIAPAVLAWFTRGETGISSHATLEILKVNEIDGAGRYKSKTDTQFYEFPRNPDYPRGAGADPVWPQLSLAITLGTQARRGYASKGRFYPPLPVVTPDDGGRVSTSNRLRIATSAVQMIDSINRLIQPDWRVSVLSLHDAARPVTWVHVGDTMDTQRRRRNALPEVYTSLGVDTGSLDGGAVQPL